MRKDLYDDISKRGIDAIKEFFSKKTELSERLKSNCNEEYIKRMLISQMDVDRMLLTHKYLNKGFGAIIDYRDESSNIRNMVNGGTTIQFDEKILDALFGNSLGIKTEEEYNEWKDFYYNQIHNGMKFDAIYFEEEFKIDYESEKNIIKKIIKSFRYKSILAKNSMEDFYIQKVREIFRKQLNEEPLHAYTKCHQMLLEAIVQYESSKTIQEISKMVLVSLNVPENTPIDIEEICKKCRKEAELETDYRKKCVTLGSKNSVKKQRVIEAVPFEQIPNSINSMQQEYNKAYNESKNDEEFIKEISKIYADFIYLQPYENGNKRTAICLFNSMLISKGITPPPISLVNDEMMTEAFNKAYDNEYTMLQSLILEKYKKMNQKTAEGNIERAKQNEPDK